MKKLVILGFCLVLTTGCGRGWFPRLFRGAPCSGCGMGVPAGFPGGNCGPCAGSATGAGFGGYDGYGDAGDQGMGSGYVGEQIVDGGIVGGSSYNGTYSGGIVTSPSTMAPLAPTNPAH